MRIAPIAVLAILACSGCNGVAPNPAIGQSGDVDPRMTQLSSEVRALRARVRILETQHSEVTVDPSTKGFDRLDTTVGALLVSCQDVRQYANGYKVALDIGNVTTATLDGFKLNVSWGPSFSDTTVTDWENARHEKTFDFTDNLMPGRWNRVSFVLTPAAPRDLDYVTVAVETGVVSLLKRPN